MAMYGDTKYFFGYVCADENCENDRAEPVVGECSDCGKPLEYTELWRDDDYLDLYEMMA